MVKLSRGFIVASLAALLAIACRDDELSGPQHTTASRPSFLISPGTGNECVFDQVRSFDGEGFARGVDVTTLCNTFGRIDPWTPIYFNPSVSVAWISGDPDDLMPMQPGPVTFTFHDPVFNPVVVTSGEMACFGDLGQVTAHTVSEQTVTVSLAVADPSDCGEDNKTNSYISPPIITSEPIRMIEVTPPSVMEWHFDYTITICDPECHPARFVGDPRAHIGYSVYFREPPDVPADFRVECSPSPVIRGGSVTCQATVQPAGTAFNITEWRFTSDQGFAAVRTADISATSWSGTIGTSGDVSVTARVGDRELTKGATITVTPRDWSSKTVSDDIQEVPNDHLPLLVTNAHELGDVHQTLTDRWEAVTTVIADGPNEGLAFLSDLPFVHEARIHVNRQALARRSPFWDRHAQANIFPGGTCNRDYLTNQLPPLILAHEGLNLEEKSHTWFYKRGVEQALDRAPFESLIGFRAISAEARGSVGQNILDAHDAGKAIAGQADQDNPVRFTCTLRYF